MGDLITVGYGTEKTCFMKQLDPAVDEVWEMRSRDPKPGIRVFGSFAMQDVFVATHMAWREDLGGPSSLDWAQEIRNCKVYWRQLAITYPPHTGVTINDYISENVVEIRNLA